MFEVFIRTVPLQRPYPLWTAMHCVSCHKTHKDKWSESVGNVHISTYYQVWTSFKEPALSRKHLTGPQDVIFLAVIQSLRQ